MMVRSESNAPYGFFIRKGKMEDTPVTLALNELKIPYRTFEHAGQVHSVEQAAQERGMRIDQVVRSIVFRVGPDYFVMVLVAGTRQISWPILRKYLNHSRLTMATEEEVLRVTGYRLGAVSPFGLPAPMQVLVDQSVLRNEEVSIGAGVRNTAIILKTFDLLSALGQVEMVKFTGDE
jgi:Cys-tRNA(Pro)/Cys-tRNA(Cys) deacylase